MDEIENELKPAGFLNMILWVATLRNLQRIVDPSLTRDILADAENGIKALGAKPAARPEFFAKVDAFLDEIRAGVAAP